MTYSRCFGGLLTAALALSGAPAQAGFIFYSPRGPYITQPRMMMSPLMNNYWSYNSIYPAYNPYVTPYPTYGILPPPFVTETYGSRANPTSANPYGAHKTAEDYGYSRGDVDPDPRKRGTLYPAVPFGESKEATNVADGRRVRFNITVPNPNAVVLMDGVQTRQAGTQRTYMTPPLEPDRQYTSTIEVRWIDEGGVERTRRKTFDFTAGETIRHTFRE